MAVHHFEPDHYHIAIGPWEPVLNIQPGDRVVTSTVDAGGRDRNREQKSPGGNPQTGPFFVEGAEPGDTLVVTLDRLTPNREYGYTASVVAANVVDPHYVRQLPTGQTAEWKVDTTAWTATLVSPQTALGSLVLPLDPMIGCFGVAPPRHQAISCATSAEHGGNMDYRGFRQGVTVYFPVFVPGALFHIGDGHA
ncbi:MAG: acetamidase, partial [Armatimonadetes bacterium]|nr:acetamidase [Armatimonadota bacterium]